MDRPPAMARVEASLLEPGDPAEPVHVFVAARDLEAVHRLLGREPGPASPSPVVRVPDLLVPRHLIPKIAALPGVLAVWPFESVPAPLGPDDLRELHVPPGPEPTMRDAIAIQDAVGAWARGYTGAGIRVYVMDTGVDFGHPDLNGTQARVEDPASPYFGWPLAFDTKSMMYWLTVGTAYPASDSWYSDTSATDVDGDGDGFLDATGLNVTGIPSASGVYHRGLHPDAMLQARVGPNVTVLLADTSLPGVYDTVYVDLDNDGNLSDEWPQRRGDEVASRDVDGDGLGDRSAGMVYFLADGTTPIPYSPVIAAEYGLPLNVPGNGNLVAFALNDASEYGGAHGTLCASAVAAQGVISGGIVQGMAPDARIITSGNVYNGGNFFDNFLFAAEGYDGVPGTGDEAHLLSGSFGDSDPIERGWEYWARVTDDITVNYAPQTAFVIAAGNGGYGYGTVVTPGAGPGILTAGAATSFGVSMGVGEPTWGDVISWSDRGPSPLGQLEPDVVSVGNAASGDVTLNQVANANAAWSVWAGTSLATPVTAGAAALVYQAFRQARGVAPTTLELRDLMMSTARDLGYDVFLQGAGFVNASRAVDAATRTAGISASPAQWNAGGFRGQEMDAFARVLAPGASDDVTVTVTNHGPAATVSLADESFALVSSTSFTVVANTSLEDGNQGGLPDYMIPIVDPPRGVSVIPPNADHVRISAWFPYGDWDVDGNFVEDSRFTLGMYAWRDLDGDGLAWNDTNGDNVSQAPEWDGGEIAITNYASQLANRLEVRVGKPWERLRDGWLLGIYHVLSTAARPLTNLSVLVEAFEAVDEPWITMSAPSLSLGAGASGTFTATVSVPPGTAPGTYEASLVLETGGNRTTIPVVVNVAATDPEFAFGGPGESGLYRNGQLFGGYNWGWRPESGDWRYFFLDVPDAYPFDPDARFLLNVSWDATPGDVNAYLLGNATDAYSAADPARYGPYTLGIRRQSANTYVGGGKFLFQTATGGPEEILVADLGYGLNEIALHSVINSGLSATEPLRGELGRLHVSPSPWDLGLVTDFSRLSGTATLAVSTTVSLPPLEVRAFGVSQPLAYPAETVLQDVPANPATASWSRQYLVADGGLVQAVASSAAAIDLDLYLLRDANGNSVPDWGSEVVASDTGPGAAERVSLKMPANGTYWLFVHGYDVPNGSATFAVDVDVVQGTAVQVTSPPAGPISSASPRTFEVAYDLPMAEGPFRGVLFLGPSLARDALMVWFRAEVRDLAPEISGLLPPPNALVATAQPRVGADVTDLGSGVNVSSLRLFLDGSNLTSMATATASGVFWDPVFLLPEGVHTAEVFAADNWGNVNSTSWSFTVDTVPPILQWADPPDGWLTNQALAAVRGTTEPGASLTVQGVAVPVAANGSFQTTVALAEGSNGIAVTATDAAGNAASETRTVTLDTAVPAIALATPADGTLTNQPSVWLSGATEPGATLTVGSVLILPAADGTFGTLLPLLEGANGITVTATDAAGNSATASLTVTLDTLPPPLAVTSPADGLLTKNASVLVAGTTEPGVAVRVLGVLVPVAADGSFSRSLTLAEGANGITVTATDAAGNAAAETLSLTLDTVPPPLAVTSPAAGSLTNRPVIRLAGTTEPGAAVTAGGLSLAVAADGAFDASLPLLEGENRLLVLATDAAGNTRSESRVVTVDSEAPIADAGANRQVEAGASFTLDASGSSDNRGIADYAWTVSGPGFEEEWTAATAAAVLEAPGVYEVSLTVRDEAGNAGVDFALVVVTPPGDADADALPDAWEMAHFGGLGRGPRDDPDADGFTNLQEEVAGTDPNAPDSDGDGLVDGRDPEPLVPRAVIDVAWILVFLLAMLLFLALFWRRRPRRREPPPDASSFPPPSPDETAELPPPAAEWPPPPEGFPPG